VINITLMLNAKLKGELLIHIHIQNVQPILIHMTSNVANFLKAINI